MMPVLEQREKTYLGLVTQELDRYEFNDFTRINALER